jgi:phage FluMu protein Com
MLSRGGRCDGLDASIGKNRNGSFLHLTNNNNKRSVDVVEVIIKHAHCNQCGQDWTIRLKGRLPVQCPRCKRVDWSEPKKGAEGGNNNSAVEMKTMRSQTPRTARPRNGKQSKVDLPEVPRREVEARPESGAGGESQAVRPKHRENCPCTMCRIARGELK